MVLMASISSLLATEAAKRAACGSSIVRTSYSLSSSLRLRGHVHGRVSGKADDPLALETAKSLPNRRRRHCEVTSEHFLAHADARCERPTEDPPPQVLVRGLGLGKTGQQA